MHAHVSPELAVHGLFDFAPETPDGPTPLAMTHGYVLEKGKVYGLKGGAGVTERAGLYPEHIQVNVTDSADRTWEIEGRALTTFPWQSQPGVVGHNCLLRWSVDGQTGYGECMDFVGLGELGEIYSRL